MVAVRYPRIVGQPPAWRLGVALLALMIVSIGLTVVSDRAYPRDIAAESVMYVRSGEVMKRLALEYDALLADVYWIRALQHFGGTRRAAAGEKKYELLEPLLSIAVSLDPLFNIVYRFGAIFLAEAWPGGPGRPDQAIALLERGLQARPGHWRYMQDIGFVYYWSVHDYQKAAEWFDRGAQQPGAPWWMRSMAAAVLAQGGDRQASRVLWQALAQTPDNEWLRRDAARRLQQLDALDQIDALQKVVRQYIERGGARPYSWQALVRAGYLRGVPVDPANVPYELGPWSGDVSASPDSPLQPLPTEPPHVQSQH